MSKFKLLSGAVVAVPLLLAGNALAQTAPANPNTLPTDPSVCSDATTGAGQDCVDNTRPGSTQNQNGGGLDGGSSLDNEGNNSSGTLPDTDPGTNSGSGSGSGSSGGLDGGSSSGGSGN